MLSDPLPVVEAAMERFRRGVQCNPLLAYERGRNALESFREVASRVFGGNPSNWALSDSHTSTIDRVAAVLSTLGLGGGRPTVVTTDGEHVGGIGAFLADPSFFVLEVQPERIVETSGDIYFISQITYDTGRNHTAILRELRRARPDAIIVVDGSQSAGQIPVDVTELGCDAFLASAHKWLGGPLGTGVLYLSDRALASWPSPYRAGEPLGKCGPISRWEARGGQDFSRIEGVTAALLDFEENADLGAELRDRFVDGLCSRWGKVVSFLTPTERGQPGRVAVFEIAGCDVYRVYQRLLARNVSVKCIKKSVRTLGTGKTRIEVLRAGFPRWLRTKEADEAMAILCRAIEAERAAEGLVDAEGQGMVRERGGP